MVMEIIPIDGVCQLQAKLKPENLPALTPVSHNAALLVVISVVN